MKVSFLVLMALLLTLGRALGVESAPAKQLVYSFTRSVDQDVTVKGQQLPHDWEQQAEAERKASRGSQQFAAPGDEIPKDTGHLMDQTDVVGGTPSSGTNGGHASGTVSGTIEVDVVRRQQDRGLVVSVRERTKSASAAPVTCVVYPNTSLACDSQGTVNPEEYSLLRFLGTGFVDPTQMDANRKWRITQSGAGLDTTADYQVVNDTDGLLTIDEMQTIGSKGKTAATIQSAIGYDFNRSIPVAIDEHVMQDQQATSSKTVRNTHTVLQLVTSSP